MPHGGNVGAAVTLAVASTGCYASSAALQEREAARQRTHGESVLRLLRRPWWWLAVIMVAAGGLLHIAALALGPVSLVQPLGVLTLVFALPLGARLARRSVTRQEAHAAAAVALGLAAVVTVMPHHALATHLPLAVILSVAGLVAAVTLLLVGIATRLLRRAAPVVHAAAAATCFGFSRCWPRWRGWDWSSSPTAPGGSARHWPR
jgi:drug/metabolite transporter (DMT)-like permease